MSDMRKIMNICEGKTSTKTMLKESTYKQTDAGKRVVAKLKEMGKEITKDELSVGRYKIETSDGININIFSNGNMSDMNDDAGDLVNIDDVDDSELEDFLSGNFDYYAHKQKLENEDDEHEGYDDIEESKSEIISEDEEGEEGEESESFESKASRLNSKIEELLGDLMYIDIENASDENEMDAMIRETDVTGGYYNAMQFLLNNDQSLNDSLEKASELGYSPSDLDSERLAGLLAKDMINDLKNEIF